MAAAFMQRRDHRPKREIADGRIPCLSVQLIVIRPLPIDTYPELAMLMHAALFRCAACKS
jgi:hypothetical protein